MKLPSLPRTVQPRDGEHQLEVVAKHTDYIQSYFIKVDGAIILHLWRDPASGAFFWRNFCSTDDTEALEQWFKECFPSMEWTPDRWAATITLSEFDQAVLKMEAAHA